MPKKYEYKLSNYGSGESGETGETSKTGETEKELNSNSTTRAMNPSVIPLSLDLKVQLINCLEVTVAILSDFEGQLHTSHWNIKGMTFSESHELFDEIRDDILPFIDQIAERAITLGGIINGCAWQTCALSTLKKYPIDSLHNMKDHCTFLLENMTLISQHCRGCIDKSNFDLVTQDIYINLTTIVEKRMWFIQKHLL